MATIELGLSRIHRLLARTSLPWRAIHIAGTNGKGSICAYLSAMFSEYNVSPMLKQSGRPPVRHGRFTSPHLIDRWDCITINGETISESIFNHVEQAVIARDRAENIGATSFELLTATAFEIFTREKVDVAVVEVGMGGRLDSTNVIGQGSEHDCHGELGLDLEDFRPSPLVTAIASIGLDHQGFLGNTIEEIAQEKAGIMKKGVTVIATKEDEAVSSVLAKRAAAVGAGRLIWVDLKTTPQDVWRILQEAEIGGQSSHGEHDQAAAFQSPIQQRWANGAIALTTFWHAIGALDRLNGISPTVMSEAFNSLAQIPQKVVWPGRLQTVSIEAITGYKQSIILDGAHNAQSAVILAKFVREKYGRQNVQWIVAASAGKDVKSMLEILLRPGDAVVGVEFGPVAGMPWVKPMAAADVIAEARSMHPRGDYQVYGDDLSKALVYAAKSVDKQLVIAGSLYLVGDFLRLLRHHAIS